MSNLSSQGHTRLFHILAILVFFTLSATTAHAQMYTRSKVVPPSLFGLTIHNPAALPWPSIAFGSLRLWDTGTEWSSLEKSPGRWDFSKLDAFVAAGLKHSVDIVLVVGFPPTWASKRPWEKSIYTPGWASEPKNIELWAQYLKTVGERYKGRILSYEIWNEPDDKRFYSGSVEDLIELTKCANRVLKTIDPRIKIVSPSSTGGTGLDWLSDFLRLGGGQYVDIIGHHFYVSNNAPPEQMLKYTDTIKSLLAKHGLTGKPIWNTETGWGISSSMPDPRVKYLNDSKAAAYIVRSYIVQWVNSVDRFYFYAWDNKQFGLIDPITNKEKPSAKGYHAVIRLLAGASTVSCQSDKDKNWICTLSGPGRETQIVLWNTEAEFIYRQPPEWHIRSAVDVLGNTAPVSPPFIKIGPLPIVLEGKF